MADEINPTDKEAIAENNAKVIAANAAQDLSGHSTAPNLGASTGSALDRLRETAIAQKKAEAGEPIEPAAPAPPNPGVVPEVTPKPATPAEPTEAEVLAKAKADADAEIERNKLAEAEALKTQTEELFKNVPPLPPNTSAKAGESFTALKQQAATQIRDLAKQIEDLTKAKTELEAKTKEPIPQEITKELEDLRQFRARLDIETDPKWKQFDAKVEQENEFIYAQLTKASIPAKTIEDIKKLGGPVNVNMEKILAAVTDPVTRQVITAKLADIEMTGYQKEQAIQKAKQDTRKYIEERQKEWEESTTSHNSATKKAIDNIVSKVPWLNTIEIDLKADEAKRKEQEAHNTYASAMRKELELASTDDSAEMRATLLVGMVNLFRLQTAHDLLDKAHKAAGVESKKKIDELSATVERLKAAGTTRLRTSGSPASETTAAVKPSVNEKPGDALDRIRAAKLQQQQATT
jgi:hypothetical protein